MGFLVKPGLMERRRFISDCVTKAAEELGYPSTKQEQLDDSNSVF